MKRNSLFVVVVSALLAVGAGSASAALDAAATTAITALQADGTSMIALGWPLVTALAGGLALIGIFKKVLSKAV